MVNLIKKVLRYFLDKLGYDVRKIGKIYSQEIKNQSNNNTNNLTDIKSFNGFKIVDEDRYFLYDLVNAVFSQNNIVPIILELGVFDGQNAKKMYETFSPKDMFLVDSWSKEALLEFDKINSHRPWVTNLSEDLHIDYFGGPLNEQSTFENLFHKAKNKFLGHDNVHFIRTTTHDGIKELSGSLNEKAHLIYVDANHQYETVLDDLIEYYPLLDPDYGILQLNDCCHSQSGINQNLGVLEASYKFCRMYDFIPLVMVNRDHTDVLLARRGSKICNLIDLAFANSHIGYVEIPLQQYPNASIKSGVRANISFC